MTSELVKIVPLDPKGQEISSPKIFMNSSALALARDFDWLMKNPGKIPDEFQKETLILMAQQVRPEVMRLAIAMEMKLRERDQERKNSWKDLPISACLQRAQDELEELAEAVRADAPPEEVWREAGDAPNFIMFLAINYENLVRKE